MLFIERLKQKIDLGSPKLEREDIEQLIDQVDYTVDDRATICKITLTNGYTVHGISYVISKENFDAEMGRIAAYRKAEDKVWEVASVLLTQKIFENKRKQSVQALDGTGQYFQHHKGGIYKLLHIGYRESDNVKIAVYESVMYGTIYTRPSDEFYSKFTCILDMTVDQIAKLNLEIELVNFSREIAKYERQIGRGQGDMSNREWHLINQRLLCLRDQNDLVLQQLELLD